MNHGFEEIRTTRMEPGPDGKLVPHVYIQRREFSAEEAQEILKERERMFSGFESIFGSMDDLFKKFGDGFKRFHERYCQGKVGR